MLSLKFFKSTGAITEFLHNFRCDSMRTEDPAETCPPLREAIYSAGWMFTTRKEGISRLIPVRLQHYHLGRWI